MPVTRGYHGMCWRGHWFSQFKSPSTAHSNSMVSGGGLVPVYGSETLHPVSNSSVIKYLLILFSCGWCLLVKKGIWLTGKSILWIYKIPSKEVTYAYRPFFYSCQTMLSNNQWTMWGICMSERSEIAVPALPPPRFSVKVRPAAVLTSQLWLGTFILIITA